MREKERRVREPKYSVYEKKQRGSKKKKKSGIYEIYTSFISLSSTNLILPPYFPHMKTLIFTISPPPPAWLAGFISCSCFFLMRNFAVVLSTNHVKYLFPTCK